MDPVQIVIIVLLVANLVVSLPAWLRSKHARDAVLELAEDVGQQLRDDIASAVAEGADQVIAKLPKRRAAKPAPAPEEPKQ